MNKAIQFIFIMLISGCSNGVHLPRSFEIYHGSIDENIDLLSMRVMLMSDTHVHHLYGEPVWLRTDLIDKVVDGAIRSPQKDLYGKYLLRWILQHPGKGLNVIHLGDAADIACTNEFETFVKEMDRRKKHHNKQRNWAMAPGNHDSFFYGVYHDTGNGWKDACKNHGEPMTKDKFVETYRKAISTQSSYIEMKKSDNDPTLLAADGTGFFKKIKWHIDPKEKWRSYVLQMLNISFNDGVRPIYVILIDTTNYKQRPTLISNNAGPNAEITDKQFDVIEAWAKEAEKDNAILVLMGHHPYQRLTERSRSRFDKIRTKFKPALYVSGHTHSGSWIPHGSGKDTWLELNVGSTLDEPIEWRDFRLGRIKTSQAMSAESPKASDRIVVQSSHLRLFEE